MAANVTYSAALSENRDLKSKHVSGNVTRCRFPFPSFPLSCSCAFKNLSPLGEKRCDRGPGRFHSLSTGEMAALEGAERFFGGSLAAGERGSWSFAGLRGITSGQV